MTTGSHRNDRAEGVAGGDYPNLCRQPHEPHNPESGRQPLGAIMPGKMLGTMVTAGLQTVTKVNVFPSNYAKIITP